MPLPRWRVRTVRAATSLAAMLAFAGFALSTGVSYTVVSHITHMRPVTVVTTDQPEVGVLIDAPASQVPAVARTLSSYGLHASFAVGQPSSPAVTTVSSNHDQAMPRLPTSGLVRWLGARGELHKLHAADGLSAPLPLRLQRAEHRAVAGRPRRRRQVGGGRGPPPGRRRLARLAASRRGGGVQRGQRPSARAAAGQAARGPARGAPDRGADRPADADAGKTSSAA